MRKLPPSDTSCPLGQGLVTQNVGVGEVRSYCTKCSRYSYGGGGTSLCTNCPSGTRRTADSDGKKSSDCVKFCPPGQAMDYHGNCNGCPVGTYSKDDWDEQCSGKCPPNTSSGGGASSLSQCCPKNSEYDANYVEKYGSKCKWCKPGYESNGGAACKYNFNKK